MPKTAVYIAESRGCIKYIDIYIYIDIYARVQIRIRKWRLIYISAGIHMAYVFRVGRDMFRVYYVGGNFVGVCKIRKQ